VSVMCFMCAWHFMDIVYLHVHDVPFVGNMPKILWCVFRTPVCVDCFLCYLALLGWVVLLGGVLLWCTIVRQLFCVPDVWYVWRYVLGVVWDLGWMFSSWV